MSPRLIPRQYELLLTRSQKFTVFAPLVMLILIPIIFTIAFGSIDLPVELEESESSFDLWFTFIPFLAFAAFYGWNVASIPYRITATIDQRLHFKSLLRVQSVKVSELLAIEPGGLRMQAPISGYFLRHRNGKIRFPGQFTDLHVLLGELKALNPALVIRGI
jgi:hypothetical protein